MSRSVLRKDKSEQPEMEGEQKTEEPFLKIETIWSESEENFGCIPIKEEDISDVEPETLFNEQQTDENNEYFSNNCAESNAELQENPESKDSFEDEDKTRKERDKKKKETKGNSEPPPSETCLHASKIFKVLKKRLRCCDCKAVLCPECKCTISSSIQTHFSKSDNNNSRLYPCKLCSMIFRSNCALQAHIRIHLLVTPYVCPDCGAVYNNIYFLSLHLINKCYHVYKVITNGCKICLSQNMAPEDYLSHIEMAHIKPVFKCSMCGLMFENTRDINRHLGTSHKTEKATSLNYFCCSMCGNLIISKHLYSKHVKYHQDHSAAFQVGYLCPCGQSFNSSTSFRVHFKNCSKKGILPPQWTYLQVTLKTHEMMQVQNAVQKGSLIQSSIMCDSAEGTNESALEQGKLDFSIFEDGASSEDLDDQQTEESGRNSSVESDGGKSKSNEENWRLGTEQHDIVDQNNVSSSDEALTSTQHCSGSVDKNQRENSNDETNEKQLPSKTITDIQCSSSENSQNNFSWSNEANQKGTVGDSKDSNTNQEDTITDKSCLIPNVQLVEEFSQDSVDCNGVESTSSRNKETVEKSVKEGDRSLRIMYDHIPCDHLGYLKTQQNSDSREKLLRRDKGDGIGKTGEFAEGRLVTESENYLITSVLDEKTGLMKTKKVLIQKSQPEHSDGDLTCLTVDSSDSALLSNIHCRELQKSNRSSTFFSCPFCSVLFPKHFSSFQRFRLHLECYHPEAALDITVNRTQIPKSQTKFSSIRISDEFDSEDDSYDLENVDLQTRLNESLKEDRLTQKSSSRNDILNDVETENDHANPEKRKKTDDGTDPLCQGSKGDKSEFDMKLRRGKVPENKDSEGKSDKGESKLLGRRTLRKMSHCKSIFQSSLRQRKSIDENNEGKTSETSATEKETEVVMKSKETSNSTDVIEEHSDTFDSDNFNIFNRASIRNEPQPVPFVRERNIPNILKRQCNLVNYKNRRLSEDSFLEDKEVVNDVYDDRTEDSSRSLQECDSSKICRVTAAKNKSEEYPASDTEFEKSDNASQSNKDEGLRRRSADRKNSRRESDVWSEFYKTLKIAETLKKTTVKNREKDKESTKVPILNNYTNKRIVKKPKRYRESSDSEDSNEDGKQSPSDSKSFENRLLDMEDDDLYIKKKKLLNRLEHVDHRIMDYIFDLIDNKEKNYGLLKKSENVRSCRKRLVNGIRMGRQKINLNAENDDDTNMEYPGGDKELCDLNCEDGDWDLRSSLDDKNGDKRRGRPKKNEPMVMRERRKSDLDREANFIEKNFEAEEGDYYANRRKRKLSSKLQYYKKMSTQPEKNDFSSGQVISTKSAESEKKLCCAVCKESYQSEPEFRDHIQIHRVDDNTHQCMECGECFVVRPSLEKHLHAFHKIKDVHKYIEENDCSVVEKTEVECEPLRENQCKVCKDQFSNVHDLNKHFRIHGMAFLRQYKKDNKSN